MIQIKHVIKDTQVSIPVTGEELGLIKQAIEKVKSDTGLTLGYKKLLLYLINKELNGL